MIKKIALIIIGIGLYELGHHLGHLFFKVITGN